ncbi:MAG: hypothetical protein ACRCW2_00555, partial [Cellulosilyticaceae bacterium]
HDQEVAFMRKYGEEVNVSAVQGEVRMTVERMVADAYTARFLIAIEKVTGEPFKGIEDLRIGNMELTSKREREMEAKFNALPEDAPLAARIRIMAEYNEGFKDFLKGDGEVDLEGLIKYMQSHKDGEGISVGTSSGAQGMCHTQENTERKIYYTYQTVHSEPIVGDMVLSAEGIRGHRESSEVIATDLVAYLAKQDQKKLVMEENPIEPYERARLEELKKTDMERYLMRKEEMDSRPKKLLVEGTLDLELIKGDESCVIDNVGFVDGQLHIRMSGEGLAGAYLEVYDESGEPVYGVYNTGGTSTLEDGTKKRESYRIYDIASAEELKNYTFKINRTEIVEQFEGIWEIPLDMTNASKMHRIQVNHMIPYTTDEKALLQEVRIDKASIVLVLDQIKSQIDNECIEIKVIYKDGTELVENYSNASERSGEQLTLVYALKELLGKEIVAIQVADQLVFMP